MVRDRLAVSREHSFATRIFRSEVAVQLPTEVAHDNLRHLYLVEDRLGFHHFLNCPQVFEGDKCITFHAIWRVVCVHGNVKRGTSVFQAQRLTNYGFATS
eukprot:SAG31_NODE_4524_length_3165_cov_2.028702_2_plen_100_part_00